MNPPLSMPIARGVLVDILIDAIEWSCRAFWAQVDTYPDFDDITGRINDIKDDEVIARFRDDEDGMAEADGRPFVDVTLASLEKATQWALTNYGHILPFSVSDGAIEDIDYDAEGADIILQKNVLDGVVYG